MGLREGLKLVNRTRAAASRLAMIGFDVFLQVTYFHHGKRLYA